MSTTDKEGITPFQAEEVLRSNDTLFRALIEHSSDIIVQLNAQGFLTYVSPCVTHIMGYAPDDLLGRFALDLVHPSDLERMSQMFQDILHSPGKSIRAEYRLRCSNGSWRWFEGVATNVLTDPVVGSIVSNFRDITERKQIAETLQAEEQRFRLIWEAASDAMALSDAEGIVLSANPAYFRLYGFMPEDVVGKAFSIIFPQEQQEWAAVQYRALFESEQRTVPFESTIQHADGTIRIVESTYDFLIQHGRRIAMISIIRDITQRKQAQEQLRASEERFRILMERSADAIALLDKNGRRMYATPASKRVIGYEPTESVGEEIFGYIHPEDVQMVQQVLAAIIQQPGKSLPTQFRVRHKQGHWVWVEGTGTNLLAHPDIEAVVVNYRDITERKHLEIAIRQSKQQLEVILQNIADGISVQDAQGNVVYMNDAGAYLCGYSSSAEVMAIADFQAQRTNTLQRFDMYDEQGNMFSPRDLPGSRALRGELHPQAIVQYRVKGLPGNRWSLVKAQPILDEDGQVQLAVTVFSDITEAYEAEKRKDEFIGIASHELKTPLTTMKGLTQLVKRRLEKQEESGLLPILTTIESQINRVIRLVNDLLDVSKIQAGQFDVAHETINLDELLHAIVEMAQLTYDTHTITLQGSSHGSVRGDRDRLEQVFLNLIHNAIKYSPQAHTVTVCIIPKHGVVLVRVRDEGVGIPMEQQRKIFERFYRVSTEGTRAVQGLGMGLYISSEIVKHHGGEITVESEEGKGSTFIVSLPLSS